MDDHDTLARGRDAYAIRAWGDAYEALREADSRDELGADDLERLAMAAYMTGREDDATSTLERLHHLLHEAGEAARAVRWAIWLALMLFQRGHHAQAGGWLSRAERLLGEIDQDVSERGLLLVPAALQALGSGDTTRALELCEQVATVGKRFDAADLTVLGILGQGQALVAGGDVERGIAMLDEAMVAVTTGDVSPMVAGIAYCALIISCRAVFDLHRAQEWTAALDRWCRDQQDLHPYRGQCLVHRSEIMQLRGDWAEALEEAERACDHLADPPGDPVMGMARYQQAELLRLRGEFAQADRAYRLASEWGHPPQPGLALLRLAQGRVEDAAAAIRREVAEAAGDRVRRARVLAAYVDILLAAGDLEAARDGADELERIAADFTSLYLGGVAAEARGAVLLSAGEAREACEVLREAWRTWQRLDAPYDAARVRLRLARSCRELDDHETADMELDAARPVFQQLGAAPALREAGELTRSVDRSAPGGLTPREVDVLRLVVTGATNREIAATLVISEKTVARHLSNMFTKLGIHSRAAATAWAYEHDLA